MAMLLACLGESSTWSPVLKLASMPEWEKVLFFGPQSVKDAVQLKPHMEFFVVDDKLPVMQLSAVIAQKLGAVFGEVGLSMISGSGALHMALLSAVLKCGGGIRLVNFSEKFEEL